MRYLTIGLTLLMTVPACSRSPRPAQARGPEIRRLPPEKFAQLLEDTNRILVNAEPAPKGEIPGTRYRLSGPSALDSLRAVQPDVTRPLAIYCERGQKSDSLAQQLARAGYRDICVLSGGYRAWAEQGLPFQLYGRQE